MKKNNELKAQIILDFYLDKICKFNGLEKSDVLGKNRKRELSDARAMVAYLTKQRFEKVRLMDIAEYFKITNHATVFHRICKIEDLKSNNWEIKETLEHCEEIDFVDELLKSCGFTFQQIESYTIEVNDKIIVIYNIDFLGTGCNLKVFEKIKSGITIDPEKKYTIEHIDIFDAIIILKNINSNPLGTLINSLKIN